jgi:4-alpha-glucanotransferase
MRQENTNQNKRVYRSPTPTKNSHLRERLTSQCKAKINERNAERKEFEKQKEKWMQENLDFMKDKQENSSKNPNDDILFKMADTIIFF